MTPGRAAFLIVVSVAALAGVGRLLCDKAPSPQAFVDREAGFSLRAPDGWLELRPAAFKALADLKGGTLPQALIQVLEAPPVRLTMLSLVADRKFAPAISVAVLAKDAQAPDPAAAVRAALDLPAEDVEVSAPTAVAVDGIRSSWTQGRLTLKRGETRFALGFVEVSVPGRLRTYRLTCVAPLARFEGVSASFRTVLDSFTELDASRAWLAFLGALVGAAGFLVLAAARAGGSSET